MNKDKLELFNNNVETILSKEMFDNLYSQALALEARYKKLFELYNNLMEMYLSSK